MATVHLRGALRKLAAGQAEHEISGETVLELMRELERAQPPLAGWILDERGRIRRHICVFVGGERSDEKAAVAESDRVEIIPAISGGDR